MKHWLIIIFLLVCSAVSAQQKWTITSDFTGFCGNSSNSGFNPYFLNENYGFLGFTTSGCGTITRTTDGGKTWTQINQRFQSVSHIFFYTPSHLYLCSGSGPDPGALYESLDSGITWLLITTSYGSYDTYVSDGVIYLGQGVRSFDDGKTWIIDLAPFQNEAATIIGNKESGVASFSGANGFDQGTLYTLDSGNTWQVGQPKDECYTGYAVPHTFTYFRSSEITYLGYGDPQQHATEDSNVILRSKDGGATWQKVFPNFPPPCWLSGGIAGGGCAVYAQSHYKMPGIDNTVLGGVWRSTDLGNTWDSIGGPANGRDTRISVVSRGAICYASDGYAKLWKFTDSALLRNATWDMTLKRTSAAISNDTLYAKTCDSASIILNYGFTSCDYVKLDTISVEGIPRSDYRVDFIKDKVIMENRSDTSGITFIPSVPGTYHIKVHTFVMRDDWVREDTAFSLVLVVSPNPAKLNLTPDSINFAAQTLCNNHLVRDTIHLSDTGCDALTIKSITLETDAGSQKDFTFTNVSNFSIAHTDAVKNFPITYFPKSAGNKSGRIIIITNLGIDTIFLSGIVTSTGSFALGAPKLDFDTVSICNPLTKNAYLVNNSCDSLLVTEVYPPTQASFVRTSPPLPVWLRAGDSLEVIVLYSPKTTGATLDSIEFLGTNTKGAGEYLTLLLSGYGEPGGGVLSYEPKQFSFKSISICSHDSANGFVANIGCDSLQLDPANIFGDPDFQFTGNSSQLTVKPGDTVKYEVYLNPAKKGLRLGYLILNSNDGVKSRRDSIPFSVTVTGGTMILAQSVNAIDFGKTTLCEERDTVIHIQNLGCDTLQVSGVGGLVSGFGTNTKFPIIILPGHDTTVDIFTTLDTSGGKTSNSASLTFQSTSDTTLPPIILSRSYIPSKNINLGIFLDPTPKYGGDQSSVSYDIKQSPGTSFTGAGIKQIQFDLKYNTDLLDFQSSLSSSNLSSIGTTFTIFGIPEITANANGILATLGFRVYLTKDSTTSLDLVNMKIDTSHAPCTTLAFMGSGSAIFDYQFLCGERSIGGFMNGVLPLSITSIRPNPAQDEIEIDLQSAIKQDASIEIRNALGSKVFSGIKNLTYGSNSIHLGTKGLGSGVYLVRVGGASQSLVISR